MADQLSYTMVDIATAIYLSWTITYFFCPIFPSRWNGKYSKALIFFILVPFMTITQLLLPDFMLNTGNFQFQLTGFVICLLLFRGKFMKKLNYYLFYMIIEYTVELMSANIYVQVHNLLPDAIPYSIHQMRSVCTALEYLIILMINIILGIIFFRKAIQVMNQCNQYLNIRTTFHILFPLIMPTIIYSILQSPFVEASSTGSTVIYWLICISTFYYFPSGMRTVRRKQLAYIHNQSEMEMVRRQLETSAKMQEEYTNLRKWNHDAQNHLVALSYLMDMQRYPEALNYCNTILSYTTSADDPSEGGQLNENKDT